MAVLFLEWWVRSLPIVETLKPDSGGTTRSPRSLRLRSARCLDSEAIVICDYGLNYIWVLMIALVGMGIYCSSLNLVAFAKIMKKYDKVVKHKLRPLYLKEVERTYFASSDEVGQYSYLFPATNVNCSNDQLEILLNWWCLRQLALLESSIASEGGTVDVVLKHHECYVAWCAGGQVDGQSWRYLHKAFLGSRSTKGNGPVETTAAAWRSQRHILLRYLLYDHNSSLRHWNTQRNYWRILSSSLILGQSLADN